MKLSMAWIFDHIDADWRKQDIKKLVAKFNRITAEIENYYLISFELKKFALGKVQNITPKEVCLFIPENKKEIILPFRDDIKNYSSVELKKISFLIDVEENRWVECENFGLKKEGNLPPFDVLEELIAGRWRKTVEIDDLILEIDNKSITHRPDMWGHRGFAREIAAILDLPFLPKDNFLATYPEKQFGNKAKKSSNPFVIKNKAPGVCRRFSGLYFKSIENKPSDLFMATRLMRVGVRSINVIVDLTNYVMLDWSQPMHVFDAEKVKGTELIIKMANKKEQLTLLDESKLELTKDDLVIANAKAPMSLAGVMGGVECSMSHKTKSLFLESANFEASYVRRSAIRHKIRTESSTRFEKTLDPNQIVDAILRFLKLANQFNINFEAAEEIFILGEPFKEKIIEVSHEWLEKRAGLTLSKKDVIIPLEKIGFDVQKIEKGYTIKIPSFRGAKDVGIKEDILEEVVRFYGLDKVKVSLPMFMRREYDMQPLFRLRKIKTFLVSSASMIEQQNYAFFDEEFLSSIEFVPKDAQQLVNPVSENYKQLATTLIPHLFKNVKDNFMIEDRLSFFEFGRTWKSGSSIEEIEHKKLAGIFFHKRDKVDFYECKHHLVQLFSLIGIKTDWKKLSKKCLPWQNPHQSVEIFFEGQKIGIAGKVDGLFLTKLDALVQSDAFVFELDGDFLLGVKPAIKIYKQISKYQETTFDLSFFVPLSVETSSFEVALRKVDPLIQRVSLLDFFEKDEWTDKRALAFRIRIGHLEKTLAKEEIEDVRQKAIQVVQKLGAKLRS